jgi:hypothetical protein
MIFRRFAVAAILVTTLTSLSAAQERQWMLDTNDTESYLIFGVPETDDVGVSFWCTLRSGRVKLFVPEAGPGLTVGNDVNFKLQAGEESFGLTGRVSANEEAASTSIEAEFGAGEPILAALEATDRFALEIAGERRVFPLIDADLESFLSLCRPE